MTLEKTNKNLEELTAEEKRKIIWCQHSGEYTLAIPHGKVLCVYFKGKYCPYSESKKTGYGEELFCKKWEKKEEKS